MSNRPPQTLVQVGTMRTMPGLPTRPAFYDIDIDMETGPLRQPTACHIDAAVAPLKRCPPTGNVVGLF